MAYKVSITTRVSVTADTADEVRRICDGLLPSQPVQFEPVDVTNVPALDAAPEPPVPEAESEPPVSPPSAEQVQNAAGGQALGEAIECYLTTLAASGRASTTLATYRIVLEPLVKRLGASYPVGQIATSDMVAHLAFLNANGLAPATVTLYGRICKGFFRWLAESEMIQASPMRAMKLPVPRWNPVPPFTDDEIQRLLAACTVPVERAAIALLVDTGLRASELTNLRLKDIQGNELRVFGKGSKPRTLALNDRPKAALGAYIASCPQQDGLLWPEGWHRKGLSYMLTKIGHRAGVEHVFPHRFRHTFASNFLRETGDAMALKALMGHSSLMMTNCYIAAAEGERALRSHAAHSPLDALSAN